MRGWSTVKGQLMCGDDSLCNTTDSPAVGGGDNCCNTCDGLLRCPIDLPYMCNKVGECADVQDHCCLALSENCNTAANCAVVSQNSTINTSSSSSSFFSFLSAGTDTVWINPDMWRDESLQPHAPNRSDRLKVTEFKASVPTCSSSLSTCHGSLCRKTEGFVLHNRRVTSAILKDVCLSYLFSVSR